MKLYSYCRSSASYRVRIALNLKRVEYTLETVNIVDGEQVKNDYLQKNVQGLVPALELDSGVVLTQSLAIIEFLDTIFPVPRLVPVNHVERALIRSLASVITNEIQPLNNLRILNYLKAACNFSQDQITDWYHTWMSSGFCVVENKIVEPFCAGEDVTLVDCCLVPQVYNARRFKFDMTPFPKIESVYSRCLELDPFYRASPELQPDY